MRFVEKTLIAFTILMFVFKEITLPFAGIGLSVSLWLLAIFYLTSKIHIFRSNEFNIYTTIISSFILAISIIFLNFYLNNWSEQPRYLLVLLVIQILWLIYFIIKEKSNKKLRKRLMVLSILFLFMVMYSYLITFLQS